MPAACTAHPRFAVWPSLRTGFVAHASAAAPQKPDRRRQRIGLRGAVGQRDQGRPKNRIGSGDLI